MKTIKLLLATLAVFLSTAIHAQDFDNPAVYNEYINKQNENVVKKFLSYNSAVAHGKNARKVEKQRSKLMDEVQESRMNIAGLPSFKGDKAFRDTAVSFLKLYFNVLNEDYSKIVNMEEIAEQSYDLMEAYLLAQEKVDEKLEEANLRMREAQKKFAESNNMKLDSKEDDLSAMMKEVGETNEYHHKAYLIFFKSYKQEIYLSTAAQKGDLNGIEQNRSALLSTAKEGLDKLNKLGAYKGDNSLVTACKNLLNFYIKEAEEKVPAMVDFYMKKDKFEAMKKELDKKPESKRTEADIDNFNKAVADINSAANLFNSNNKTLYDNLNELVKGWDEAVNEYFKEHTPVYKN